MLTLLLAHHAIIWYNSTSWDVVYLTVNSYTELFLQWFTSIVCSIILVTYDFAARKTSAFAILLQKAYGIHFFFIL